MLENKKATSKRISARQRNSSVAEPFPTEAFSGRYAKKDFNSRSMKKKKTPYICKRKKSIKEARNIENVTLGDVRFQAWYSSWYPKDFLGKENKIIKDLYVCSRCFAYSRGEENEELWAWFKHWQICRKKALPGEKIYVHDEWVERTEDTPTENKGVLSIWEVDGAIETLFCQNLSLFAKLFLENKSVFFDVSGFNFFLLVYAPPKTSSDTGLASQIIGFFSKEKISWDSNNLACILVFPPWQRKGLGSLLIGISYAIAQRKNIMGGPERPISDLGLKGYRGFWGRKIAKFLLSLDVDVKPCTIDIETISRETWISSDDCLTMIKEMDILDYSHDISEGLSNNATTLHKYTKRGTQDKVQDKLHISINKQRLREWVVREGLQLVRVVSENGFRPGYALEYPHCEALDSLINTD
ncbi:Males-absent on the first protein [Erysiphe neolycopersici]|uniref:histone acetyltransferase n=1 Tax=Erysiphe neolycopersici TaxID=212602 RepID=A0A420HU54_9PEZI|nr:Males-absent on the first protein [Erysiphe neolycopersici]